MSYRNDSLWNDNNEIKCLMLFKYLQKVNFSRGIQKKCSEELAKISGLGMGSISAKVSNFKSLAGINAPSNCSKNSKDIYERYSNATIKELEDIVGWAFLPTNEKKQISSKHI